MKKVWLMLAILVCVLASCSGGGDNDPITPTPNPEVIKSEITIDSSIITNGLSFTHEKGEQSISFSTNENWTLNVASTTSGATWCTASSTSGTKGTANVKFTVSENTDYDNRNVSVTIKSGTASKTFTISQKCADALLVTTDKYEIAQEGGTIDIEVKANIEYKMEISEEAKDWISESSGRGLNPYKHTLKIAMNEENKKREGEVIFKSGDKVETVKIYQAGGAILLLLQDECHVSDKGSTITVNVQSNIEFGVQMPDVDWIVDEASNRGLSSHTLKYVIRANEGYDSRSASIVFFDKNSNLQDTLKITQAQKDAIVISQKKYEVKADGETIEVKLSANVDFKITMPDVDWIEQVSSRVLTEHTFYFKVKKNEGEDYRSANIVFVNKNTQLSDSITITQKSKFMLALVQDEYNVDDAGETISVAIRNNIEYAIQMPDVDWIAEATASRSISTDTLKFIVSANKGYDARSAEIIFFDKNNDLQDTLKVIQAQKDAIILSSNEYKVSQKGGNIEIEVSANVDYITEISDDWIKSTISSRALESKKVIFTIVKNEGENIRTGTIAFVYGSIRQVVNVIQYGETIPYVTFKADAEQIFHMSEVSFSFQKLQAEYSVNGNEWTKLGTSSVTFGGNNGDLRLRGKSLTGTGGSYTVKFYKSVSVACSGDIRTLIDYENYKSIDTSKAHFSNLFRYCYNLTSAPELPATTLAESCYRNMFYGCTSLTSAPELPATTLAPYCYENMFAGCTNLTSVPKLPATTLAESCYRNMFHGCTSLTSAPELPATTLAEACYYDMFYDCTSLTCAPELPATTLASNCYQYMFHGCSSLTNAPELPAKTLAQSCYSSMFDYCTNLISAPKLPATTLASNCYFRMFYGCTNLTNAPELPATTLAEACYYDMFYGCSSLTSAPELPATTLAPYCYNSMFAYCTSLTSAPELPATTLARSCYETMFASCKKLKSIT